MGKITTDQSHKVIATLAVNTDWESIDFENSGLQDFIVRNPKEAGRQFTAFLKNGGRIAGEPKIIKIDRVKPFNPAEFIGSGWSIWRGPKDCNGLKGEEEQDKIALALTEVDLNKIRFETMLKLDETRVNGEEKLTRLKKAGHIRLDAKIFQTLLENPNLIPEEWKEKTNGKTTYIFFDGTILRSPDGDRCVLCLCWDGGKWYWRYYWLDYDFDALCPSAVLAS